MIKNLSLLSLLILLILFSYKIFGQSWQDYPFAPANSFLSFPYDDGFHADPKTETEWWYMNLNLTGSAPSYKKYSVILVYFRFANMRLFNIACETDSTFKNSVIQQPFQQVFSFQQGHWELAYTKVAPNPINDYSRWTFPIDSVPYSYIFHAEDPANNDGLDVKVISNRTPMVVGGNGYIPLGDLGDSSYYYSYSNMRVSGTIKYNSILDTISSGIAWIDRQYGPFTVGVNSNNLYEWFSLQLDNPGATLGVPQSPYEFNIWQIFADSNNIPYQPEWRLVTGIYPDDSQDTSSSYFFERTGYWFEPGEAKYYSQGWRFINPAKDITIDMEAPVKDQIINVVLFKFWEGGVNLKGIIGDKPVEGVGFAEIVAGHNFQIITPSAPSSLTYSESSDHYSISWLASSPGTFTVGGYRVYRSKTNDEHWKYLGSTSSLSYDDYTASMDTAYYYTVTSFDNQTATSASKYAPAIYTAVLGEKNNREIQYLKVFPNPSNGEVIIDFFLATGGDLKIEVFDLPGRKISSVTNSKFASGEHRIGYNTRNLASGTYFLRIQNASFIRVKKILVNN